MKKYIFLCMAVMIMAGFISACGQTKADPGAGDSSVSSNDDSKISIVTTIFPEYDWVKQILGDQSENADVTMLLDSGVDLHSYQPSAEDMLKISNCDLFIYVGGESDEWVEDALENAQNKNMKAINLLDVLGDSVKAEEVVEGMEHQHDHDDADGDHDDHDDAHDDADDDHDEHDDAYDDHDDHDDAHDDADDDHDDHDDADDDHDDHDDADDDHDDAHEDEDHDHGDTEYDEHVWLSLRNAVVLNNEIAETLATIDPDNAETYKANCKSYTEKLEALDQEYQAVVKDAKVKTLLFGDRFPFRYLVDDYQLSYYAAFAGCSAETEASFETITFLAKKVDELSLNAVMTIEGDDHRIAETIVENTKTKDQKILTMDSMQSTTAEDVKDGVNYLSVMENNLSVLKTALQ